MYGNSHIHTCTCTHNAHTNTYKHTYANIHKHMLTYKHTHTYIHKHTHTYIHRMLMHVWAGFTKITIRTSTLHN